MTINSDVVVRVNDACHLFECAFRDGVSEDLFRSLKQIESTPGYIVDYGVNLDRGGLDKSMVQVYHDRAQKTSDAAKVVEGALRHLGFQSILWKRDVIRGCLESETLTEIF